MKGKLYLQEAPNGKLVEGIGKVYGHFLIIFDKKENLLKGVYYVSGVKIGEIKDEVNGKKGFYIQHRHGRNKKI